MLLCGKPIFAPGIYKVEERAVESIEAKMVAKRGSHFAMDLKVARIIR